MRKLFDLHLLLFEPVLPISKIGCDSVITEVKKGDPTSWI